MNFRTCVKKTCENSLEFHLSERLQTYMTIHEKCEWFHDRKNIISRKKYVPWKCVRLDVLNARLDMKNVNFTLWFFRPRKVPRNHENHENTKIINPWIVLFVVFISDSLQPLGSRFLYPLLSPCVLVSHLLDGENQEGMFGHAAYWPACDWHWQSTGTTTTQETNQN